VASIYFTEITQFFNIIPDHLWCIFYPWLEFKNFVAVSILAASSETVRKQSFSLLHSVNSDISKRYFDFPKSVAPVVLPLYSSLVCSVDRCDHHGCLFSKSTPFSDMLHPPLRNHLEPPSTGRKCRWGKCFAQKTELKNFFVGAKFAMSSLHISLSLEYHLTDWFLRHLLHITRSTSVAYYWEITIFFNIKVTG